MKLDEDEVQVYCRQCNGYLYSIGPAEVEILQRDFHLLDPQLRDCPMVKDWNGKCTGKLPTR